MNKTGNMCAQVKKRLNAGEKLTGEYLAFALGLMPIERPNPDKTDLVWLEISRKLKAGEQLGNYEHHLMVDVVLLHVRLQAASREREENGEQVL